MNRSALSQLAVNVWDPKRMKPPPIFLEIFPSSIVQKQAACKQVLQV